MKTLIIHSNDRSTDFLKAIYKDIKNATIITGGISKSNVIQSIKEHDRIIMLGHGSPYGLFSMGLFPDTNGHIIDNETADLLQNKPENIYIWCHASSFVKQHDLKGFCSGMFISETREADFCGVRGSTQKMVTESNELFCDLVGTYVFQSAYELYDSVAKFYGIMSKTNKVAKYNHERLYVCI